MSTSIVQFRIDDELKTQATEIYEELGLDLSTALRIFLKRSVAVRGIPFSMILNDEPKPDALSAMAKLQNSAEKNGTADLSLDEINAEIAEYRQEKGKAI
ncbi:MAG: type II toxin-antitoxin system RelB/DinJ family antitoxin [Oscillospiraceae bacterium]|nr:type II toxin-antitoxin system RelB/DinJ family antitoxin [Oscillospiraceae bacterium]